MVKVIICGALGKMGGALLRLCLEDFNINVVGGVERPGIPEIGMKIGYGGRLKVTDNLEKCVEETSADVIIDFTNPESSVQNLSTAMRYSKAMVIGATGFDSNQMERILIYKRKIPVVVAPNFSVGVNIMFKALADVAKITGDAFDVEIVEAHHNRKEDAPSGTAKRMAEIIARALNLDFSKIIYERVSRRREGEIGIQSVRGGDIFGDHTVMFCGQGERMEFIHRAHNRECFARGAIMAAKWVVGKPEGLYDMQDVLGL